MVLGHRVRKVRDNRAGKKKGFIKHEAQEYKAREAHKHVRSRPMGHESLYGTRHLGHEST